MMPQPPPWNTSQSALAKSAICIHLLISERYEEALLLSLFQVKMLWIQTLWGSSEEGPMYSLVCSVLELRIQAAYTFF